MTKDEALKMAMEALEAKGDAWIVLERKAITAIKEVLAQPLEERNFCPRCGKRAGKHAWDVHTCSLPEETR